MNQKLRLKELISDIRISYIVEQSQRMVTDKVKRYIVKITELANAEIQKYKSQKIQNLKLYRNTKFQTWKSRLKAWSLVM